MRKLLLVFAVAVFFMGCGTSTDDDENPEMSLEPGLYIGNNTIPENGVPNPFTLSHALNWLSIYAIDNTQYTLIIGEDQSISAINLNTSQLNNASGVKIIIKGKDSEKIIQLLGNGSLFTIGNSVSLTISKNITLKGINGNTNALIRVSGGILNIEENGIISNNSSTSSGGGIYLNGGTFNMLDGKIENNTSTQYGGGVLISGGIFNMYSGKIVNNFSGTDYSGGAVSIPYDGSGTFNLYNGEISENGSNWGGGGISLGESGIFNMVGGKIIKNTGKNGAGILNGGKTNINGGNISGNFGIIGEDILTNKTLTLSGDHIIGNIAIYGYGSDDNPNASTMPFITIIGVLTNSNQTTINLTLYDKNIPSIKNNWSSKSIFKRAVGYNGNLPLDKTVLKDFISWDGTATEEILTNYHIDNLTGELITN